MIGMSIDVAAARDQTPGTARVAHLNNAGASLPSTSNRRPPKRSSAAKAGELSKSVVARIVRWNAGPKGCDSAAAS